MATELTREGARDKALEAVRAKYSSEIDQINSEIDRASGEGFFSVFIEEVFDRNVQNYFIQKLNFTFKPKEIINEDRGEKTTTQGTEIFWNDEIPTKNVKLNLY